MKKLIHKYLFWFHFSAALLAVLAFVLVVLLQFKYRTVKKEAVDLKQANFDLSMELLSTKDELKLLKTQDQYLINRKLMEEIKNIHDNYLKIVSVYGNLLELKTKTTKTGKLDELLATALRYLSDKNYASAEAILAKLDKQITEEEEKAAAGFKIPVNVPINDSPPGSGYSRQRVKTDLEEFLVDIISADLSTTKVIVDTASESDCADNCPVLSLSDYVSRNGAYAGVNGSYFCPSTYPDCVNKKNSFDTLLMNKNKKYFNSDNNVYSTVPAVIFQGSSIRFVAQSLEWGRDTGVDGVIANHPLLVFNNAVVFSGDSVAKHNNKGGRSFVGAAGSNIYIGVVRSATVLESAKVLHALGIHNALNLDDGGSTALWYSGYKVGPGRNIPNAVLFVKR